MTVKTILIVAALFVLPGLAHAGIEEKIEQRRREIRALNRALEPELAKIRVHEGSLRVWVSGGLLVRTLQSLDRLPPEQRRFHFDSTGQRGPLKNSSGGGLGCGWYVELQDGGDLHGDLDMSGLSPKWSPDGHLTFSASLSLSTSAQVHWHIRGPAGPSFWPPRISCDHPVGGGFGGNAGIRMAKNVGVAGIITLTGDAATGFTYALSLTGPEEVEGSVAVSLQHVGEVGVPLHLRLPLGQLYQGSLPVFAQEGRVEIGTPPWFDRRYRLAIVPRTRQADVHGIYVTAQASLTWSKPEPGTVLAGSSPRPGPARGLH